MRLLYLVFILLFTSCGIGFQYTTLNHVGHVDGIYSSKDIKIDTLSEFQFRNKLRNDLSFRLDFAQYALSQPRSFDWNNRLLGSRYNRNFYGYSYYWNRDQMWNDWAWGYPWFTPHRWSPFGYDRWGYNGWINNSHYGYGYNYYGWNNYGWNNSFYSRYRGTNVVYHTGRRSSTRTTTNRRVINNRRVVTTPRTRTVVKNKPRVINNKPRVVINNKPRINTPRVRVNTPSRRPSTIRTTPRTSTRSSNTRTVRSNSRRKN